MECNSCFPKAWTLEKEANNSNNKIHKPVSVTEHRNNPVELKSRKRALLPTTKSTYLQVFASWYSVNYKDDHRHSGEETGHALPQFGHPEIRLFLILVPQFLLKYRKTDGLVTTGKRKCLFLPTLES